MKGTKIRIRRFRNSDLRGILRIESESFGDAAWPESLFRAYARSCELFLTAHSGGAICGYSITCVKNGKAELASIAVAGRYRRKGVAARLIRLTIKRLKRRCVSRITLMVRRDNEGAIRLYRHFGFRRVRTVRGYYEDGSTGWRMVAKVD